MTLCGGVKSIQEIVAPDSLFIFEVMVMAVSAPSGNVQQQTRCQLIKIDTRVNLVNEHSRPMIARDRSPLHSCSSATEFVDSYASD